MSIDLSKILLYSFKILSFGAARKFEQLELFYYFSTDEVFGPSDNDKFQEWVVTNPYAATKAAVKSFNFQIHIFLP